MKYFVKVFTLILLFLSPFNNQYSFAQSIPSKNQILPSEKLSSAKLKNLVTELKYYDEILTASVLSYAFSGEEKWLIRYNEFEPKLGQLITTLLSQQHLEDNELISSLNKVNDILVALETRAIELVSAGDRQAAMTIVNGEKYHLNKNEYMSILLRYVNQIEQRIERSTAKPVDDISLLTTEEKQWVDDNKIIVGIEHWPPIIFMGQNQLPGGLSGEILAQIVDKFGLQVEYITGTWEELFAQFKQGEIDLLPDAYMLEGRKNYGQFSTPYFLVRELFYVKQNNSNFQSNFDLSTAKIAISAGYTTVDKIKANFPNINIVETKGIEESVNKVLSGEVDALLDAQIVVDDWIKQRKIKNIRVIDEDVIFPPSLHFLSHKNKDTLHSILQKGLDSIKASDLMNANNEWLTTHNQRDNTSSSELKLNHLISFVVITVLVLLILGSILSSIVLKTSENQLVSKFGSGRFKNVVLSSLIAFSILLIVVVSFIVKYAEKHQLTSVEYSLDTLLSTANQRLDTWIKFELGILENIGKNKELGELVENLLVIPEEQRALLHSPLQSQIRKFFHERKGEFGETGFFIISPSRTSLSSLRDDNVGIENLINLARPELLNKVFKGNSVFIPPLHSDLKTHAKPVITKQIPPTMFFASPILNSDGAVIAVVTKRINFEGIFSSILSAGFIGKSGETYAIDKSGILLSNVRFEDDLFNIGFLEKNEHTSLKIRISDPGENLLNNDGKIKQNENWPLTKMANQISQQQNGSSMQAYRDYRGVNVIGTWLWNDTLNMGLAAEVDVAEALEFLTIFKYTVWSILFISLILVFGGTLFTLRIGTRATAALARSHSELENLVHDRTEKLEANMQRTQTIIDNASDGIIVVNKAGIILTFSPAAESIFDYTASEVKGKNLSVIMNHNFNQEFLNNQLAGEKPKPFYELIGCKKSKTLIDIEVAVGEAKIGNEHLFTGMVRDTTLRKIAERELKQAMAEAEEASHTLAEQIKFQQLLMDTVPIPLFYKDKDGKFQGFNKAYEETFNVKSQDLIGLKVTDLIYLPIEDRLAYQAEDKLVIAEQSTIKKEIQIPFADGKLHDTLYWVKGFTDRKNNPAGLVGNFIDITAEKENARQLEIAVKTADEATKAKSDFLANMSHEIRTPMNAIIGMSYLALQTDLNRKQADYVNKIHSSADALLGIINDILDFSKIEAGKLELEHIPFNLNETIDHLVQIISHKSQQKELELLIDLAPDLPLDLIGDSLRLGQILINLTNNSIKFTDHGEIIVKAKKLAQDDENVTIEFSVCDTGIGMTPEQLGRLFQSFSQADASTTRKYGGTGLGLTISKTLTELMQGKIWVESNYGEGSQFYFAATFGLAKESTVSKKTCVTSLANLPVLIVDDSLAAREILFNICESLGFLPELAPSGAEALDKLKVAEDNNTPFKLVLADWKMPHMDGIELGSKIANDGLLATPPVFVIVTAYDRDEMLRNSQNINIASSITKPVSASTLLDITQKVMGEGDVNQQSMSNTKLDFSAVSKIVGAEILLVEDNEINQQIAVELLEMAGLSVTVANNGKVAIELIESRTFDAVLMDIQMPIMDGYTATKAIRKNAELATLPIIAMTANAMTGDKEKCIAAGMNDHLAKPIDPKEVYRTLAQWVEPTGKDASHINLQEKTYDPSDLPNLPEFDVKSALSRMGGNIDAYRKTLKKVATSEAESIERIRQAVNKEDFQSAELIAHTLKGVSGNIGAKFVIPSAEKLELIFNARVEKGQPIVTENFESLLLECEIKLAQMLTTINNDLQSVPPQKKQQVFNVEAIQNLLSDLKAKIDNFDTAAIDTLQEIIDSIENEKLSSTAIQLANALEGYNFVEAETLVVGFEKEIELMKIPPKSNAIEDSALIEKFTKIEQQVANFDSTVVDSVDEILDYELESSLVSALEKVRKVLSEYDFDTGEALLSEIKTSYFQQ